MINLCCGGSREDVWLGRASKRDIGDDNLDDIKKKIPFHYYRVYFFGSILFITISYDYYHFLYVYRRG